MWDVGCGMWGWLDVKVEDGGMWDMGMNGSEGWDIICGIWNVGMVDREG